MTTEEEKKDKPVTQADRLVFTGLKGALVVTVFLFTPLLGILLNAIEWALWPRS